jgi:S-layer protein (TIGR01564 family)
MGNIMKLPGDFSTRLDVDTDIKSESNLLLVGGPVTNQLVSDINPSLPVRFSEKKPWGILSSRTNKRYSEETMGLISKIKHPYVDDKNIIVIAGISAVGTKAAVMALTRSYNSLLGNYTGQSSWGAVINGFDMDGDGRIDTIEVLE